MRNTIIIVFAFLLLVASALFLYKTYQDKETASRVEMYLEQARLEQEKEKNELVKKEVEERKLDLCLEEAEKKHSDYLRLNGTVTIDESGREVVRTQQSVFDKADETMKDAKEFCFKRYQN